MTTPYVIRRDRQEVESAPALSSVEKAMVVLTELAESGKPQNLRDLTKHTGLAKATVHRLLAMLVAHRMVERIGEHYVPGDYLAGSGKRLDVDYLTLLRRESTPYLMELYKASGHTAVVGALAMKTVHYVNQVYGRYSPRMPERSTGDRLLAEAIGLVLTAYQPGSAGGAAAALGLDEVSKIRGAGIACTEDVSRGVTSVAVPVMTSGVLPMPIALAVCDRAGTVDMVTTAKMLRGAAFELARVLRRCASSAPRRTAG
ncbi:helix-turn-helix domain-containing protein [Amycolatopsis sp. cg5]|uniref:helix-turn-helix domain-containing protein n=1 Tax=Amycolatopsis sp. cg5 TaxID=3238802 RepID=UPI00352572D8